MSVDLVREQIGEAICDLDLDIEGIGHEVAAKLREVEGLQADRARLQAALDALGATPVVEAFPVSAPAGTVGKPEAPQITAPKKRGGGSASKVDRAEVARVAVAAHQAGQPMVAAVMTAFETSHNSAKQLIYTARKEGHAIPAAIYGGARHQPNPPKYDRAEVARICRVAQDQDRSMETALIDALGCSKATAGWLIIDARSKGFDIPKGQRGRKAGDSAPRPLAPGVVEAADPVARARRRNEPYKAVPEVSTVDLTVNDPADVELPGGVTLEQIAADYRQLVLDGKRPVEAMSQAHDRHRTVVNMWLAQCRERGLLPPRDEPQVELDTPGAITKSRFA